MARFALYSNGKKLENLEDLKDNFTLKDMENNFRTKSLHRWLTEKGLRDELQRIENIPSHGDNSELLMECFALSDEQRSAVKRRAEDEAKRVQEEQKAQANHENGSFSGKTSDPNVIDIPMPEFSSNDQKVILAEWRVQVGDKVKKGDIFCEVETNKATFEVESQFEGVVSEILVQAGDEAPVSTTILRLEPSNEDSVKQNSHACSNIQTTDRVAAVVKQIIGNQLAINPQEIKDSDDIIADLGADEDDIREMQWSISQEFDLNFNHLTNVGQIIACVKRR